MKVIFISHYYNLPSPPPQKSLLFPWVYNGWTNTMKQDMCTVRLFYQGNIFLPMAKHFINKISQHFTCVLFHNCWYFIPAFTQLLIMIIIFIMKILLVIIQSWCVNDLGFDEGLVEFFPFEIGLSRLFLALSLRCPIMTVYENFWCSF